MWEYQARVVNVVDGDTLDVQVDLGFYLTREVRLRLLDVDTHEVYGVEKESEEYRRGKQESAFVEEWVTDASGKWPFLVRTEKTGKYGRYLAVVERRDDGEILNNRLLDEFEGVGVE